MTLSDDDKKMVGRLRKREAILRRWRWPLAIVHGCFVLAILVALIGIANFPSDDMIAKLTVVSFLIPPLFVFLAFSSLWLCYVIAYWNGDPRTHLLLKLIDDDRNAS